MIFVKEDLLEMVYYNQDGSRAPMCGNGIRCFAAYCFDEGITVVEWSEFIEDQLPQDHIKISFEEGIDENRTVTLEYTGPVSKSIVEAYHD